MPVIPFPPLARSLNDAAPGDPRTALASSECFAIAAAVRRLPGNWVVQWDEDEGGQASMALLPDQDGATDGGAPTFLIWRQDGRLQLYVRRKGRLAWLGSHLDADGLIDAARRSLDQPRLTQAARSRPPA